jgi:hypothetical protein
MMYLTFVLGADDSYARAAGKLATMLGFKVS